MTKVSPENLARFNAGIKHIYIKDLIVDGNVITIVKGNDTTTTITVGPEEIAVMSGASSSTAGTSGLVPAPAAGSQGKFLRGDGTWQTVTVPTKVTDLSDASNYALKSEVASAFNSSGQLVSPSGWKLYVTD